MSFIGQFPPNLEDIWIELKGKMVCTEPNCVWVISYWQLVLRIKYIYIYKMPFLSTTYLTLFFPQSLALQLSVLPDYVEGRYNKKWKKINAI